jgi:glycerophosphoryl diester phosphodiesterase
VSRGADHALRGFRRRDGDPPRVFGHRGVRRLDGAPPPENTLAAFEIAAQEGAHAIECDVRRCASGELVVFHDPTLSRMTGGLDERPVAAASLDELRRLELAGAVDGACGVPTLAEVLAFARERRIGVNVEMKHDAPDRAAVVLATARLLRAWDDKHAVLVSSFDPLMLAAFGRACPGVPRAILLHRTRYYRPAAAVAPSLGADAVHLERTLTSPALVARLRARGVLVNVWTVNHPGEARDLAELGVDGIITDRPAEILQAVTDGDHARPAKP